MFHLVRKAYWYTDEYILSKTLDWLKFSVDSILEDRYNEQLQLAQLIQLHIAQLMIKEKIDIPRWSEIKQRIQPEEEIENLDDNEPSDEELRAFWIFK